MPAYNVPVPKPLRNPETHQKHKKEVFWQITFPIILGVLLLVAVCVLVIYAVAIGGDVSDWADISLIFLIILVGFLSLIPLVVLGALVYLITMLIGVLPPKLYQVQLVFKRLHGFTLNISNKIVEPVMRTQGFSASVTSLTSRRTKKSLDK